MFALAVASAVFWGSGAPQGADAGDYRRLAENLLAGRGFTLSAAPPYEPSARRAPVYPVFLAAVYTVAGRSDKAVLGAQALLWGLGCLGLAGLVGRAGSPTAGWVAGALVATHTLVVSGGITEYYLRDQLWHWTRDLEKVRDEARKQLGRVFGRTVH